MTVDTALIAVSTIVSASFYFISLNHMVEKLSETSKSVSATTMHCEYFT